MPGWAPGPITWQPTVAFFGSVLGLPVEHEEPDFVVLRLPDGAKVEVFGPGSLDNRLFTTGPVAGYLVDDVDAATARLVAAGVARSCRPLRRRCCVVGRPRRGEAPPSPGVRSP